MVLKYILEYEFKILHSQTIQQLIEVAMLTYFLPEPIISTPKMIKLHKSHVDLLQNFIDKPITTFY